MTAEDYEIIMREVRKEKQRVPYILEGNRLIVFDDTSAANELELLRQEEWLDSKVMFKEAIANLKYEQKTNSVVLNAIFVSMTIVVLLAALVYIGNAILR